MVVTGRAPRRQRSRGVAALEFALSLTFLVPLLMGTLDFGYYFYVAQCPGGGARRRPRSGAGERGSGLRHARFESRADERTEARHG